MKNLIVLMMLVGQSCAGTADDAEAVTDTAAAGETVEETNNTTKDVEPAEVEQPQVLIENAVVEPNPNSVLSAIVSFSTSEPCRGWLRVSSGGHQFETGLSYQDTQHKIVVVGMRADSEYSLQIQLADLDIDGPVLSFTTPSLPSGIPEFEFTAHQPAKASPGITLFGVEDGINENNAQGSNKPLYIGVDEAGYVVWYYADANTAVRNDRQAQLLADGTILISLLKGFRVISIGGDTLVDIPGGPALGGMLHHDAVQLPDGSFAALARETQTIDGEKFRGDRIVQADSSGTKLLWSWSAFDHLDTSFMPGNLSKKVGKKDGAHDWTHANGLSYLPDDQSFLISMRHHNHVIKVDHKSGNVVWTLGEGGDFELTAGSWFYSQHSPNWRNDGRMLIYDNGNERPGPDKYSRAVAYQVDEKAMTAQELWSFTTDYYTSFLGSTRWLENGNILVCAGGQNAKLGNVPGPPVPGVAQIVEVTMDSPAEKVWEIKTQGFVFRATRTPSFWIQ
jgi:hypothetical protein